MNKQEAIETIKCINTLNINDTVVGQQVDMVVKSQVLDIISQIDEPQKVVIPRFVALLIEKYKDSNKSLYQLFDLSDDKEFNDWFLPNGKVDASRCDVLASAWLDGYEIEQEKLYTVEIPNPNRSGKGHAKFRLEKIGNKVVLVKQKSNECYQNKPNQKLTESAIKEDFEWAWQFAKEVE